MKNITNSIKIAAEKIGNISVSIYKDKTGSSFFRINPENDNMLQISYVIEDVLKMY